MRGHDYKTEYGHAWNSRLTALLFKKVNKEFDDVFP